MKLLLSFIQLTIIDSAPRLWNNEYACDCWHFTYYLPFFRCFTRVFPKNSKTISISMILLYFSLVCPRLWSSRLTVFSYESVIKRHYSRILEILLKNSNHSLYDHQGWGWRYSIVLFANQRAKILNFPWRTKTEHSFW